MRGARTATTSRARSLRRESTEAEQRLWRALRDRRLASFKFVRQAPVAPYFADFLCRAHKLIVEVDGATHGSEREMAYDQVRDGALRKLGYRVLRVNNDDIYRNLDGVVETIYALRKNG